MGPTPVQQPRMPQMVTNPARKSSTLKVNYEKPIHEEERMLEHELQETTPQVSLDALNVRFNPETIKVGKVKINTLAIFMDTERLPRFPFDKKTRL